MATSRRTSGPVRTLLALAALVLGLAALLASAHFAGDARLTPKLGLDLEGGTQLILEPRLVGTNTVSEDQISEARDIIVQRVDANGVAGAEVTTQGGRNIVVSMPGTPPQSVEDAIRKSSQMQFRPVLVSAAGSPQPAPTASSPGATPTPTKSGATVAPGGTATPSASATTSNSAIPQALATTATPTAPATATPTGGATADPTTSPGAAGAKPKDNSDLAWITDDVAKQFEALDCGAQGALDKLVDDPAKPLVTCSTEGDEKFILGPVDVSGDKIKEASAGYQVSSTGQTTSIVEIQLSFNGEGATQYAKVSERMISLEQPRNRLAATLDSKVIVAPSFQSVIPNGQASITGSFTIEEARQLADQLKFGALPMSFDLQTRDQISPTLGGEQLRLGLLAGLVGLALVVIYSLFQYRALGLVTVASLALASLLTYLAISILGWSHNLRLDMAGVTGLIVAIGFTADSFIVYFERVRDEVREGRSLAAAVDTGWSRAQRTILAADGVNLLAAVVLYLLASSNVRGFAFTLGLTTIIDIIVVFMFTHPMVHLLARTKFFSSGNRWSGLDPERLGAKTARYAGRGRIVLGTPRTATNEGSAS